ncbi:glucose-6-phosphate isomerase, cytosolic 2B-like, partial [Quercus lobata]|uniref:glucose-6-phosphate isomerase, cytosolic 2B-like n=1 Tax=Quercus lobata TaxID=97700 RepID=UPI0012447E13
FTTCSITLRLLVFLQAILPYSQALEKFAPRIQQASMESNGKGVSIDGVLPFEAGEIDFGEPGTNGLHSFYQLIHQGRVIPCDFIGVVKNQQPVYLKVPRSGLAWKHSIDVGVGVIDADYRGPDGVILFNHSDVDFEVKVGDGLHS